MAEPTLPGLAEVEAAAARLAGRAVVTPLLENPALNDRLSARVLIKAENLQRTGSFKFRGAYNRISQIPADRKAHGVVAYSSGNHAQGVAAAAQLLGIPATIVMPADAPRIKLDNTRTYGAEVVLYDRASEKREERAGEIAEASGATLVPPYDDPAIIAGQGTCGLEICRQAEALGARLDCLLVCCGGGGLTAGIATAVSELSPRTRIFTVEPEGYDDTARSLAAGKRVENAPGGRSSCDALLSPMPGALTFEVNRRLVEAGLSVSEDAVQDAVRYAFTVLKLVVEPGGAVALAALLSGRYQARGQTLAITLSGGNIDPESMQRILAHP